MAASTTIITACDAVIKLDNAAGTLQDISGSSNSVEMDFQNDVGEFKPFGTDWKQRIVCGKDASFDLEIVYSSATDEALDILKNWYFGGNDGPRTLEVYIPNAAPGSDKYAVEVVLESWSPSLEADSPDPIMASVSLQPSGEVVWSVVV